MFDNNNPENNTSEVPVNKPEETDSLSYSIDYTGPAESEHPELAQENSEQTGTVESSCGFGAGSPSYPAEGQTYIPPVTPPAQKKSTDKRVFVALVIVICIVVSSVFGAGSAFLVSRFNNNYDNNSKNSITINQVTPEFNPAVNPEKELTTVQIVEKTADSVVEIITETVKTGVFAQQYIQSGAGSGVIIDDTGHIVTNHHVIEGAQKITVTLRSGESYSAKLLGSDSRTDLALLKIEAQNLTSAVLGNSDILKVGQRTVAIGNPLGQLGGSVTEGILSALNRDVVVGGQTMNLLQTDTAINPGNSGGGLFDSQGNLIGIVVAKSSGSEVEGLGFAIPVNGAVDIIADLLDYGYVRGRVYSGMEFIDVDSIQLAWMYGLSETGVYVYSVEKGSNAETAGFKSGDLITSVDGKDVTSTDEIEEIIEKKSVGDEVVFSVKRNYASGDLKLILEEYVPDTLDTFGDNQNN
ncbi:MAG: PDZ domain-containing protein [Ruminococcaceae bacterium]|nr:PDZ domain-containing protein [Oscillospiraceae bacterium]